MLPANMSLQITDVVSIILVFLSMNWILILTFYIINQEIQSIWTTDFLMSCYYFICSRWYAYILQLLGLQYICKQYLDKLMHCLMLIKSKKLEKEWSPFILICTYKIKVTFVTSLENSGLCIHIFIIFLLKTAWWRYLLFQCSQ